MNVSKQPEYQVWSQMKQRCYNKKHKKYRIYGQRGITVCDRWKNSYINFIQDMGPRPSNNHSIDRINNNGIYEPSNCRWLPNPDQHYNKSNNFTVNQNDRFGKLTHTGNKRFKLMNDTPNHKRWELEFTCDCGNTKWYRLDKLKHIHTPSCGSKECKENNKPKQNPGE